MEATQKLEEDYKELKWEAKQNKYDTIPKLITENYLKDGNDDSKDGKDGKLLYWLFAKEIITVTTSPTSLSRLIFYPRPTVIYVLVFNPKLFYFTKKIHFFIKHY